MTESENLRHWLNEPMPVPGAAFKPRRKLLSLARWCDQIDYNPGNFNRYLSGKINLVEPHLSNMVTIAEGFGYVPLTSDHHFL